MAVTKEQLTRFIVNEIDTHPSSVAARAARKFGISRQRVQYRIDGLIEEGALSATGNTRARRYSLKENVVFREVLPIASSTEEDVVFTEKIAPHLDGLPANILGICNYGFTEMFNNAIDHSLSPTVVVTVSRTSAVAEMTICDNGVGIFKKIKEAFALEDERHCLLELMKGKLTTDRSRHSGEGIFFTSRAFDHFSILSSRLYFWHRTDHDDWLVEARTDDQSGTFIRMRMCTCSPTKLKDVFDRFTSEDGEDGAFAFSKTHVPISLAQYGDGNLVSRSQAKRVLSRFDQFAEVLLDFTGISEIGQAFADEIYRVFRLHNPEIKVGWINANKDVTSMIRRALAAFDVDVANGTITDSQAEGK